MLLLMYELKTHLVISKYTKQKKNKDYPGIYSPKLETKQKNPAFSPVNISGAEKV